MPFLITLHVQEPSEIFLSFETSRVAAPSRVKKKTSSILYHVMIEHTKTRFYSCHTRFPQSPWQIYDKKRVVVLYGTKSAFHSFRSDSSLLFSSLLSPISLSMKVQNAAFKTFLLICLTVMKPHPSRNSVKFLATVLCRISLRPLTNICAILAIPRTLGTLVLLIQ